VEKRCILKIITYRIKSITKIIKFHSKPILVSYEVILIDYFSVEWMVLKQKPRISPGV